MVDIIIWIIFGSVLIAALPLQLLGLPGTWFLVADAFFLRLLKGPELLNNSTVIILCIMALLAEIFEFIAAAKGARSGPPVRGSVFASIAGAILGGIAGAPILFGLGAIPGMALGAWLAVFIVAIAGGAAFQEAFMTAFGAMVGRIKGTALKMILALAMVAVIIISLVL